MPKQSREDEEHDHVQSNNKKPKHDLGWVRRGPNFYTFLWISFQCHKEMNSGTTNSTYDIVGHIVEGGDHE